MQNVKKIDPRPNISLEIADKIRRMIVSRKMAPGQRINEVHLSVDLGVSRTPLREALFALVSEGALESIPRRGFFVTPLTEKEIREIYPMRGILDPEALRLGGIPKPDVIEKLEKLNDKIRKTRDVEQRIILDDEWHLLLVSACPNPEFIRLIKYYIQRTHRYEVGYLGAQENLDTATTEHDEILKALKAGDLETACHWLKQNMSSAPDPLIAWLETQSE